MGIKSHVHDCHVEREVREGERVYCVSTIPAKGAGTNLLARCIIDEQCIFDGVRIDML